MTDPRRLCQILLNGVPGRDDLQAVENVLNSALAAVDRDCVATFDMDDWQPAHLPIPEDPATRRHVLRTLAPTLLLDGVWLARVAQPVTSHLATESQLFELYCRIVGLDDPARSPPRRGRANLTLAGVHLPSLDDPGFFLNSQLPDFALHLPALHLGLMHRPRTFFPELLGYTLAHVHRAPTWWDAPTPDGTHALRAGFRALALAAWKSYPHRETQAERIRAGWHLYRQGGETLLADIASSLVQRATAEDAMAAVIRAKLPQAIGYHGRVKLAGRSLDGWLKESRESGDIRPLLRELGDSSRIDRTCPAASRLVKAMEFGGAMFGVFDEGERQVCLAWINAAETASSPPLFRWPIPDCTAVRIDHPSQDAALSGLSSRGSGRLSVRHLYPTLLRAESPADFPPAAAAFVARILRRTRWLDRLRSWHRFPYSLEAFHDHIEHLHRRELARYRLHAGPPTISREFCRWAALQLTPAILVDGAWLAGVPTAAEKLGEMGRHLLNIYADELGNGRTDWNHANVHRRLLESLDIDLPPFDSEAFADHPGLLAAAFDIPVYLLAIGQQPDKYFPEMLGLNLAIELSGLGAGYMRVVDILRHHGIDPTIIQLHLSIDNLASGHAARARETIVSYLDGVGQREGWEAVQAQWRRVWTGYRSLSTVSFRLAGQCLTRYLLDRARLL